MKHGKEHHLWKGGKTRHPDGYITINTRFEPLCNYALNSLEHRYIMAKHLGRPLEPHEHVHHKNEIKDDNRIENLELLTRSQHMTLHKKGKRVDKIIYRTCKNCKTKFEPRYNSYKQTFCTQKCAAAWSWSNPGKTRKKHSGWKEKPVVIPRNCEWCSKEFTPNCNSRKTRFCNRTCSNHYMWSNRRS